MAMATQLDLDTLSVCIQRVAHCAVAAWHNHHMWGAQRKMCLAFSGLITIRG